MVGITIEAKDGKRVEGMLTIITIKCITKIKDFV
jgi:hypothetical protein